jgi:Ni/Fe-hydrogenase subunit HybB-like protein
MNRVRKLKFVLWAVAGLAAAAAAARFLFGLGPTTNLSDSTPWGIWIGFDVMSGVALAAGGFIVTATVYIFRLERFHAIVRPAVLTAFLGYVAVAVSLLFDLGLPWNIWHMLVFWNPHSPLFEVGWCVMLYLTVLALEFFPVPSEDVSALAKIRKALIRIRLPLVIAGIGLSTLHQSSLGSLFLIMPYRLHPLWYTPLLPVLFFVSAIGLGLMMVLFESHVTAYLYRREPETERLAELGGAARWVLVLYLVLRFGDLAFRGQLRSLWGAGWQVGLFWFELAVMAIVPAILLFVPRVRGSRAGQWTVASLGVFGVVLNRIDVGGLAHLQRDGAFYVPAWTEVAITLGIVAVATLAFLFVIEHFKIWEQRPADPDAEPAKLPEFDDVGTTWLGVPAVAARTVYSIAFIVAAAAGFAFLEPGTVAGRGVEPAPVHQARGGESLWIDGNLDGYGVSFKHENHGQRGDAKAPCVECHHMNLPRDRNSACSRCHSDMYRRVDAFRHDWHASPTGARLACIQCHRAGEVRTAASAKNCASCHKDLVPAGATIKIKQYRAVSYVQAMHELCIGCHQKAAREQSKPELARCAMCHKERRSPVDAPGLAFYGNAPLGTRVVLPTALKP